MNKFLITAKPIYRMLVYFLIIISVSIAVMGFLLCLAAFSITKIDTPEYVLIPLTTILLTLSSFLGSFFLSKIFRENGLLIGISVACVFTAIIVIISLFFQTFNFSGLLFTKLSALFASGMLGGIMGVNSQ